MTDTSTGREVAYAVVEVADTDALGTFLADVIGLAAGPDTADGAKTWTNDRAAHRIIATGGPSNDLVALGVEIDADSFDAAVAQLQTAGFDTSELPELATLRRVERLARTDAPWGSPVELVAGLTRATDEPELPLMPGGFLTKGQGFGHAVIGTMAFDESIRFLTEGLGMAQSDWMETEIAPGIPLEVQFFHCNPRHHSIALARAPFELPQRLHHLMVEAKTDDEVGAAFDRAYDAGLSIPNGLGRHDNDRMFSFYVQSPAGFLVEVGTGGRPITQPWTESRRYDRMSEWGHQPVAPRS